MTKFNSNLKLKEKENNLSKRVIPNGIAIKLVLQMFLVDPDDLTCLLYIHSNYIHIQFILNLIRYEISNKISILFRNQIVFHEKK